MEKDEKSSIYQDIQLQFQINALQNNQKVDNLLYQDEASCIELFKQQHALKSQYLKYKRQQLGKYINYLDIIHIKSLFKDNSHLEKQFNKQPNLNSVNRQEIVNFLCSQVNLKVIQSELIQKLTQNNFVIMQSQSSTKTLQIHVKVIQHMKNYEVVEVFCQLGKYAKRYTTLNIFQQSWRHQRPRLGFGTYGNVYACACSHQEKISVKCLKFNSNQIYILKNIIKQFFIADLMSSAQLGPKILRKNGFDFLIFQNCMEFDMQLCLKYQKQTVEQDLMQNLIKMHILKIIHSDIKPSNIMYSKIYGKNIFIDFGISEISSKQIWQYNLSRFKGTIEFCGEQMKKLYAKDSKNYINLFLNDAQMLRNSIKRIKEKQHQEKSQQNHLEAEQIKDNKLQSIISETIIFLKFLLYNSQTNSFLNEVFAKILNILDQIEGEKDRLFILTQIQNFTIDFKESSKCQIASKLFWQIKKAVNLDIWMQNTFVQSNNSLKMKKLKSKHQAHFFRQLFETLEKQQESFQLQQKTQSQQITKNLKQNILFILTNMQQIIKYQKQNYFQMILRIVSFWKNQFNTPIYQKQNTARIMREIIQNTEKVKSQVVEYMKEQYLPEEPYITSHCKNIIWMYAYLLNYFMEGNFTLFKKKYFMLLLKDMIFLSFKYYLIIQQCLQKYFSYLIEEQNQLLITESIIHFGELSYLTKNHFLIEKKSRIEQKYKNFNRYLESFLQKLTIKYSEKLIEQNNFAKKFKIFSQLKTLFHSKLRSESIYDQLQSIKEAQMRYIQSLISIIENQFAGDYNLNKLQDFQKAIRIIYCTMHDLNEEYQAFPNSSLLKSLHKIQLQGRQMDITKFIQVNYEKDIQIMHGYLKNIIEKINCKEISFYFFLPQKMSLYSKRKDSEQLENLWRTIFSSFQTALINFQIFYKICIQTVEIQYFNFNQQWKQYFFKRQYMMLRLVEYFSIYTQDHIRQIILCSKVLQNLTSCKKDQKQYFQIFKKDFDSKYLKALEIIFQRIYTSKRLCIFTYIIANQILNILPQNSKKFLQFRLEFYKKILNENEFLQQNDSAFRKSFLNASSQYIYNKNEQCYLSFKSLMAYQNYRNNIFFSDVLQPHEFKILTRSQSYWNIKKIKNCFFEKIKITKQIRFIYPYFIAVKKFKQICQILIQYCIECYQDKKTQSFIFFFLHAQIIRKECERISCQNFIIQDFEKILQSLEKKEKCININFFQLCPLYLYLLCYEKYLQMNPKKWTKFLLKSYELLPKFTAFNLSQKARIAQFSMKQFMRQKIVYFSLKFAQKIKKYRKNLILMRLLVKNIQSDGLYGRQQYKYFFDKFTFQTFYLDQFQNFKRRIREKFQIAAKKILLNFCKQNGRYSKNQEIFQNQYEECYRIRFFTQPPSDDEWISLLKINEQISKDQINNEQFKFLINQTFKIRVQLHKLQYKKICQKLWNEKGKKVQDISWIKLLNQ